MKKRMLVLLITGVVLCGSACRSGIPPEIERGTPRIDSQREKETQAPAKELLPVYAPERLAAADKWDGNQQMVTREQEIYEFLHGSGKEDDPYLLKSAEDVARLAANVRYYGVSSGLDPEKTRYRNVYFRLECDIDMQGHPWWGIGGGSETSRGNTAFMGVFDGNGHAIYNFALRSEPLSGFFSFIGGGAVVKNLTIASGTVERSSKYQYAGILVGASSTGSVIENCSVCVEMTGSAEKAWTVGIVGYNLGPVTIRQDCDFSGVTFGGKPYEIPVYGQKTAQN